MGIHDLVPWRKNRDCLFGGCGSVLIRPGLPDNTNYLDTMRTFKTPLAAMLVSASLMLLPLASDARVYIGIAPPVPVIETVQPPPGSNYYWVPGFWVWDGHQYVWRHGKYMVRPWSTAVWVPGHWAHHVRGWYWVPGHWR
jgi:hypothetical protein